MEAEQIKLILKIKTNAYTKKDNNNNNNNNNDEEVIVTKLKNIIYENSYSFIEIVVIFHFWKFWNFDKLFNSLTGNNSR